jgi:hypothetical protein
MINRYMSMELIMETSSISIESEISDIKNSLSLCESAGGIKTNVIQKIKDLIKSIIAKIKDLGLKGLQCVIDKLNKGSDTKLTNFGDSANIDELVESKKNTTMGDYKLFKFINNNPTAFTYYHQLDVAIHAKFKLASTKSIADNADIIDSSIDDIYVNVLKRSFGVETDADVISDAKKSIIEDIGHHEYTRNTVTDMIHTLKYTSKRKQQVKEAYIKVKQNISDAISRLEHVSNIDSIDTQSVSDVTNVMNKYNAIMSRVLNLMTKLSLQDLNLLQSVSLNYYAHLSSEPVTRADNIHM